MIKVKSFIITIGLLLSFSASGNVVENLTGELTVTDKGSVHYEFAIPLPEGVNGISPELSLSYSTGNSTTVMGSGFSLNATKFISRCTATFKDDSYFSGLEAGPNTRFCLNGQKMVLVAGDNGQSGSEYRTRIDDNLSIKAIGGSSYTPTSWQVRSADGYLYNFERSPVFDAQRAEWLLTYKQDVFGNKVSYKYGNSQGELLRIEYSGITIAFSYDKQKTLAVKGYLNGHEKALDKLLTNIGLSYEDKKYFDYKLDYLNQSNIDLLSSITKCYAQGVECTKPLTFQYKEVNATPSYWEDSQDKLVVLPRSIFPTDFSPDIDKRPFLKRVRDEINSKKREKAKAHSIPFYRSADINNDGYPEFCYYQVETGIVCSYFEDESYQDPVVVIGDEKLDYDGAEDYDVISSLSFRDLNEDSYEDICLIDDKGLKCSLNNQGTFQNLSYWNTELDNESFLTFENLTTDTKPEVCGYKKESREYTCYTNNGTSANSVYHQFPVSTQHETKFEWKERVITNNPKSGVVTESLHDRDFTIQYLAPQFIDIDGDIDRDLCWSDGQTLKCHIAQWTPSGMEWNDTFSTNILSWLPAAPTINESPYSTVEHHNLLSELEALNEDVQYATSGFRFIDLNSDSLVDACHVVNNKIKCQINKGNDFSDEQSWGVLSGLPIDSSGKYAGRLAKVFLANLTPADINRDGLPDLCVMTPTQRICANNSGESFGSFIPVQEIIPDLAVEKVKFNFFENGVRELLGNRTYVSNISTEFTFGIPLYTSDIDGDGNPEFCYRSLAGVICVNDNAYGTPGILESVTDSFGTKTSIEYKSTETGELRDPSLTAPSNLTTVKNNSMRVSAITSDSPSFVSGSQEKNRVEYKYGDLVRLSDKTFALSHQSVKHVGRNLTTTTEYYLEPDLNGQVKSIHSKVNGITTSIKTNDFSVVNSRHDGVKYVRLTQTTEVQNDLSGQLVSKIHKTFGNWDSYNYPETKTVVKSQSGEQLTIETTTELLHNESLWLLNRPERQTTKHISSDGKSITRVVSYQYDDGKLVSETIEPGDKNQVTIEFDYFAEGLIEKKSTKANGETRSVIKTYDSLGRIRTITNDLDHVTTITYDGLCGVKSKTNHLDHSEYNDYDNKCQITRSYNSIDKNTSQPTIEFVENITPNTTYLTNVSETNKALYKTTNSTATGGLTVKYFNSFGLLLREQVKQHMSDSTVRLSTVDTVYDRYHRPIAKSLPYFEDDGRASHTQWVKTEYDDLDRIVSTVKPAADGTTRTTSYNYRRNVSSISAPEYSKTTTMGIHGKAIKVLENGDSVSYAYDPMGNLIYSNQSGLESTIEYDIFGNKAKQTDPQSGTWTYDYNGFGELISKQDANNIETTYTYDKLGRKKTSVSPNDSVIWKYYTSGSSNGLLESISRTANDVQRSYIYDDEGRLTSESLTVSGKTHTVRFDYDEYSRKKSTAYPDEIDVFNRYDSVGMLKSIEMPSEDFKDYNYTIVRNEFKLLIEQRAQLESKMNSLLAIVKHHEGKAKRYQDKLDELKELKDTAGSSLTELERIAAEHSSIASIYLRKINETEAYVRTLNDNPIGYYGIENGQHRFRRRWCYTRSWGRCKFKTREAFFAVGELNLWQSFDVSDEVRSQYSDSVKWVEAVHKQGRTAPVALGRRVLGLWQNLYNRARQNERNARAKLSKPDQNHIYVSEPYSYDSWALIAVGGLNTPIPIVVNTTRMVWQAVTHEEAIAHYEKEITYFTTQLTAAGTEARNKNTLLANARTAYNEARGKEDVFKNTFQIENLEQLDEEVSRKQQMESTYAYLSIWSALSRQPDGQLKSELFGNGMVTTREFDDYSQVLTRIHSGTLSGYTARDLQYTYDNVGRVKTKQDSSPQHQQYEVYDYDQQHRLSSWRFDQTSGSGVLFSKQRTYDYDDHGNLTFKSDAGDMSYDPISNHLISRDHSGNKHTYSYDNNGNMESGDGRNYTWTSFNKIKTVSRGNYSVSYKYDGNGRRAVKTEPGATHYYVTPDYQITVRGNLVQHRHNIIVGDDVVATYVRQQNNNVHEKDQAAYYHRDLIGSGDIITASNLSIVSQRYYTPYGENIAAASQNWKQQRDYNEEQLSDIDTDEYLETVRDQSNLSSDTTLASDAVVLKGGFDNQLRGYTSHETLQEIGLINMNARHYDPYTGRFVSADSIIPDPSKPAAFNRYAYVYGNPVSYRDPSGHFAVSGTAFAITVAIYVVAMNVDSPELQLAATIALATVGGAYMNTSLVAAGYGPTTSAVLAAGTTNLAISVAQSGQLDGKAIRGAAWSAASAGITYQIGHGIGKNLTTGEKFMAHAVAQGAIARAQGGSFAQGAISGLAGHATGHALGENGLGWTSSGIEHVAGRTLIAGSVGYLTAEATGGDGTRGAIAAATVHLYNSDAGGVGQKEPTYEEKIKMIAAAYRESGLEFSQEDALMALKTAMSNDRRAIALINGAGDLSEAQMQLALETSVVMSYSGESIELIGESGLAPLKGARWAIKNAAGHDFDLMDIRENLNDNFTSFGFGLATRRAGTLYIARPQGMGKFHQLFDPNVQGL